MSPTNEKEASMSLSNNSSKVNNREQQGDPAAPARRDVGYTSRVFVQALFPYRRQEREKITAQTGPLTIHILAPDGLPYGKYPRLILAYIMTEAVKRGDLPDAEARKIPLGSSLNEFMRTMGLAARGTGGTSGTITRIREQLERLMSTTITIKSLTTQSLGTSRRTGTNVRIAQTYDLWFHSDADQPALDESYIELSPEFFSFLLDDPIPLDLAILRTLDKPRAIDLYIWLTYRRFPIRRPITTSWRDLQAIFGADTADTPEGRKRFKRHMRDALTDVLAQWPDAGATLSADGLTLTPGQPSVPRRPRRRGQLDR